MPRLPLAVLFLAALQFADAPVSAQTAPPPASQTASPSAPQTGPQTGSQTESEGPGLPTTVLQTTVRRVVVDVVVTDKQGNAVPDLQTSDFLLKEDGQPQVIASFDSHGFASGMDYTPAKLPEQPVNTFINLPATPEKGPLYVLLFDMANMDNEDQQTSPGDFSAQMVGRQQLVKFIKSKPEGTRFAVFVHSDGLHLLQGFTSDRQQLFSVLDPNRPLPHVPRVFLMGRNFGQGDRSTAVAELRAMAEYLAEMPGRKNLIWFASNFPLSLTLNDTLDGPRFQEELKSTLNLLAQDQIAVYPVDARGVITSDAYGSTPSFSGPPGAAAGQLATNSGSTHNGATGAITKGQSLIGASYQSMDEVANVTGGHAFYGNNDVAGLLTEATRTGGSYYTLTYAPTDHDYNGKLRSIFVSLKEKGYTLAYRRSYYALAEPPPAWRTMAEIAGNTNNTAATSEEALQRPASDALSINMQHGAPEMHSLVFAVHAHLEGRPVMGTPGQMAELAMQPAYFHNRKKRTAKPLTPEPLQTYNLGFRIFTRQFHEGAPLDLEIAAAAYDADGALLNANVRTASLADGVDPKAARAAGYFSLDERLAVPFRAAFLRFAVNDVADHRVGAEEIRLPLAPDPGAATTALADPHP